MPLPHWTAHLPVGTVVRHDGDNYKKTADSKREPFPWTTEYGAEYGDERIAQLLDEGGQIVEEPS